MPTSSGVSPIVQQHEKQTLAGCASLQASCKRNISQLLMWIAAGIFLIAIPIMAWAFDNSKNIAVHEVKIEAIRSDQAELEAALHELAAERMETLKLLRAVVEKGKGTDG